MKKFKKSRIILSLAGLTALISVPIISVPTAIVATNMMSSQSDKAQEYYYMYNNKYYDSINEATKDVIIKNKPISNNLYVGDIKDAVFDQESQRVDVSRLRKYSSDKLFPAFKNALGNYEYDYNLAKKSFINPGLIKYKYDNFMGKLFNSREEAINSMRNAVSPTPIGYHKLKLGEETYNFNPLNLNDINELKQIILMNLFDESYPFKLKTYDLVQNIEQQNIKEISYSSKDTSYLSDKYWVKTITDTLLKKYLEWKEAYFEQENVSWNVDLKILGRGLGWDYKFAEFGSSNDSNYANIRPIWISKKHLRYDNVKYNQLNEFNTFLHRGNFRSKFSMWIKKWGWNKVAEEASTNNFLGTKFKIWYEGGSQGWVGDVDARILQDGSANRSRLTFDITAKNNIDEDDFQNYIEKKFSELIDSKLINPELIDSNLADKFYKNSFSFNFLKEIMGAIMDVIYARDIRNNNSSDEALNKLISDNSLDVTPIFNQLGTYKNIDTNNWLNNNFLWNVTNVNKPLLNRNPNGVQDYRWVKNGKNETVYLDDSIFKFVKKKINMELKNNSNWYKKLKYVIEYNDHPIFEIPFDIAKKYFIYEELCFDKDTSIENNIITKTQGNIADNIGEISSSLVNISSKFKTTNISNKANEKDGYHTYDYLPYNENDLKYTYDKYHQDSKGIFIIDPLLYEPNISNSQQSYLFDAALFSYNKALNKIYENNNSLPNTTQQAQIKANEMLCLYNEKPEVINSSYSPSSLNITYREYLGDNNDFNASLFNINNTILYDSEDSIRLAIEANKILTPAKVIVLYDLLGNVVNPGVQLSKNEELLTTNDAIYDSESTILDNLYRTKIIRNDPNKTFYLEDNETYTLLDKKIDMLYNLVWENKNYYFPLFNNAANYIYQSVKKDAIKIAK